MGGEAERKAEPSHIPPKRGPRLLNSGGFVGALAQSPPSPPPLGAPISADSFFLESQAECLEICNGECFA